MADAWAPPGSDRGKGEAAAELVGCICCWAGGLGGFAAGFRVCRPSKGVQNIENRFLD
jgi:hypothetical protein